MNIVPLVVIGALLVVMLVLSNRNKTKRAAADAERRKNMNVGTRVMTTSGMYGTITAVDPGNNGGQADKVTLEIAPGVAVDWALAAVREAPQRVETSDVPAPPVTDTTTSTAPAATGQTMLNGEVLNDGSTGTVRLGKPKGRTPAQS